MNEYEELRQRYNYLVEAHEKYREKYKSLKDEFYKVSPSSRFYDIEEGDFCSECNGSGYKVYGSTATWKGGIGGQAMTTSVCDKCWGSGSKSKPWPSWRN